MSLPPKTQLAGLFPQNKNPPRTNAIHSLGGVCFFGFYYAEPIEVVDLMNSGLPLFCPSLTASPLLEFFYVFPETYSPW